MSRLLIGTSGFSLQNFYAPDVKSADRLRVYAEVFATVEINSTFYHQPRQSTIEKWLAQVPEDFVFTYKGFQGVTHARDRQIDLAVVDKWFAAFAFLAQAPVRHVMLFQFPASFAYEPVRLDALLSRLPAHFRYAFEFRHRSWFTDEVYTRVEARDGTIVWSDAPLNKQGQPRWPKVERPEAPFLYLRFHGSQRLYYSSYSDQELQRAAAIIRPRLEADKAVFAYFNNDARAHAAENATRLGKLVAEP